MAELDNTFTFTFEDLEYLANTFPDPSLQDLLILEDIPNPPPVTPENPVDLVAPSTPILTWDEDSNESNLDGSVNAGSIFDESSMPVTPEPSGLSDGVGDLCIVDTSIWDQAYYEQIMNGFDPSTFLNDGYNAGPEPEAMDTWKINKRKNTKRQRDDDQSDSDKPPGRKRVYFEENYHPSHARYTIDPNEQLKINCSPASKSRLFRRSYCPPWMECTCCKRFKERLAEGKRFSHACAYRKFVPVDQY